VRGNRGWLALVVAVVLTASACTGGSDSPSSQSRQGAALARGGTLRIGLFRWNGGAPYDPTSLFDLPIWLYPCCMLRTLYYYNGTPASEGGGIPRPDLATAAPEVSGDGLTWTIHIKRGLHYGPPLQDVEITAADFVRALERIFSPAPKRVNGSVLLGGFSDYYSKIEGVQDYVDGMSEGISGLETPDPHTLRIRLTEPIGDIAYRFANPSTAPIPPNPFHPEASFGVAEGHALDYGRFLVSTGPYMFEGSQDMDFSKPALEQEPPSGLDPLVLVRNPSWRASTDPLRPAYVDRIEATAFLSKPYSFKDQFIFPHDLFRKYRLTFAKKVDAGSIDLVADVPAPRPQAKRYLGNPAMADRVGVYQFHNVRLLNLNLALPPFDDVHVRRAANMVVEKQRILELWQKGSIEDVDLYEHLAPDATEDNLLVSYHPYAGSGGSGDVAAARTEMARSRYDRDHDGVCDPPKCDLGTQIWREDYPGRDVVKADLAKIGIRVDLKPDEPTAMYGRCFDPSSHPTLCQLAWIADYPSASQFFPGLYSSDLFHGGCCNFSLLGASPKQLRTWGYGVRSVPNVDARMDLCQQMIGIDQIPCWAAFDQYLMEEVVPAIPLLIDAAPIVVSDRVASFSFDQAYNVATLAKIRLKRSS